jgi:hypothetical protein
VAGAEQGGDLALDLEGVGARVGGAVVKARAAAPFVAFE